ncbi:hypothetical protein Spock_224 [Bacillus phage Spock]|uniref:Uncharacterized protein n=1 Tax=Bacillus phage Spock TaxID=1406791 RepID=U5PXJ4_9CAUD|nr:hypothetical protein Spock_224 [Bacillus phage Spock]AGY48624.1 hypothetical protein Spock_224 [Bacillus phage Spock]
MGSEITVVLGGLSCLRRHGWCRILKDHESEIKLITHTLDECNVRYSKQEDETCVRIYATIK